MFNATEAEEANGIEPFSNEIKMNHNKLTDIQYKLYLVWKLQDIPDYRILNYLMLLKNPNHQEEFFDWIGVVVHRTEKFPTESEMVRKIYEILKRN